VQGSRLRTDIQGLRAVAVLVVALDHAQVWPFRSGFIGVDVFFVISGFLITQLLLAEATRSERISLVAFYERRARRILPAATLVLVSVVAAAGLLFSRVDAAAVAGDAVWATFFAANITFGRQGTDYFAADAPLSPLQHYWSLSIEEQYYLVWPLVVGLVVLLAVRAGRRLRRGGRPLPIAPGLAVVLLAVVGCSFALSVSSTATDPVGTYFSTPARVWELGVGGLAALLVPFAVRAPTMVRGLASLTGIGAVAWSALAVDEAHFPGSVAAVPVVGAALVLLGGVVPHRYGVYRALSVRPLRAVGDWSYSFYLWHWPVLVFADRLWRDPEGFTGLLLLSLALGLSALSHRFVETPFRRPGRPARAARRHWPRLRPSLLLYPTAITLSLTVVACSMVAVERDAPGGREITLRNFGGGNAATGTHFSVDRAVALVQASSLATKNGVAIPGHLRPDVLTLKQDVPGLGACSYLSWPNERLCRRGDTGAGRTLVLIGDSHARAWIPALDAAGKKYHWAMYFLVKEGCSGADIAPWNAERETTQDGCLAFRRWAMEQVDELHPELTVLASEAPDAVVTPGGDLVDSDAEVAAEMTRGTEATLVRLRDSTDRRVVIGDVPGLPELPGSCLTERQATLAGCAGGTQTRAYRMSRATRAGAGRAGAEFVDPVPWFCAYDVCPAVVGRTLVYRDLGHISATYAARLSEPLAAELGLDRPASG
jgi:peptidoglycan/LPS O-acetylase OafA/YrhL